METIRVALIGSVSVGKSTLLNALFVKQFSKTKIKRTTMLPYVFSETSSKLTKSEIDAINQKINKTNEEIIKQTETCTDDLTLDKCNPIYFDVPKIFDLVSPTNSSLCRLELYDIPGLDDNRTKKIYFEWVVKNFHLFDVIIFMTTIETAFNNSGEMEILQFVLSNMEIHKNKYKRNIELIVLINKCDNMIYDDNSLKFYDTDEEYKEMFDQIVNVLKTETDRYGIASYTGPLPISAEDSFIYRVSFSTKESEIFDLDDKYVHKMGINEFGKIKWNKFVKDNYLYYKNILLEKLRTKQNYIDHMKISGYFNFRNILNDLLDKNSKKFLYERLNYAIVDRTPFSNIDGYFGVMLELLDREKYLNTLFDKNSRNISKIIYDDVTQYMNIYYIIFELPTDILTFDKEKMDEYILENKKLCHNYLKFIGNVKSAIKDSECSNLDIYLDSMETNIIKHLVNGQLIYINNTNIMPTLEPENILKIVKAFMENINDLFESEITTNKKINIRNIDSNLLLYNRFQESLMAILILLTDNIKKINSPKLERIKQVTELIKCINDYHIYTKSKPIRKIILKLLDYKIANFEFDIKGAIYDNFIYLYRSMLFFKKYVKKYPDVALIYFKIVNILNYYTGQSHSFIDNFYESVDADADLTLEKIFLAECENN